MDSGCRRQSWRRSAGLRWAAMSRPERQRSRLVPGRHLTKQDTCSGSPQWYNTRTSPKASPAKGSGLVAMPELGSVGLESLEPRPTGVLVGSPFPGTLQLSAGRLPAGRLPLRRHDGSLVAAGAGRRGRRRRGLHLPRACA